MRFFEKIAVVFLIFGLGADIADLIGTKVLILAGWVMLFSLYLFFSPLLLREKTFKEWREGALKPLTYFGRFLGFFSSVVLAALITTIIFSWQLWPNSMMLFFFSFMLSVALFIQAFLFWRKKEAATFRQFLFRFVPLFVLMNVVFFLPTETKLFIKSRDPLLRSLALRAIESPENEEAQADLDYYLHYHEMPAHIQGEKAE